MATAEQTFSPARRRRLRLAAGAMIMPLLALAGVSLLPLLSPFTVHTADDYHSELGIQGIMRYAGDDPVIVFLVGPAWYDLDDAARVDQAAALAEQAERLESLDSVVIRDAGGRDVAQVFGTHVVLVH